MSTSGKKVDGLIELLNDTRLSCAEHDPYDKIGDLLPDHDVLTAVRVGEEFIQAIRVI